MVNKDTIKCQIDPFLNQHDHDEEEEEEKEEEENAILELDQVSILATSVFDLKPDNYDNISKKSFQKTEPDPEKPKSNFLHSFKSIRGQLLAAFSALLTSISVIIIKKANLLNGSEQATIRYSVSLVIVLSIAYYKNLNIFGHRKQRKLLLVRGVVGVIGLVCAYFAIMFINPSDSTAISQTNVIITAIIARIFLKEKLTFAHLISILLTVAGVLLISQPSFLFNKSSNAKNNNFTSTNSTHSNRQTFSISLTSLGILIAIFDAFSLGSVQVLIKKLCIKKVHYSISTIYTSYIGLPVCVALSFVLIYTGNSKLVYNWSHNWNELKWHLFYSISVSILGSFNQIILNLSIQYEDASKVSIIKTCDLFFIFIFQYFLLNIKSDILNIVGAVLILLSTFLILTYRLVDRKHNKNLIACNHKLEFSKSSNSAKLKFIYYLKKFIFLKF